MPVIERAGLIADLLDEGGNGQWKRVVEITPGTRPGHADADRRRADLDRQS